MSNSLQPRESGGHSEIAPPHRSRRRSYPTKNEISRAIEAAQERGIVIGSVEVTPQGHIVVCRIEGMKTVPDEFEQWAHRL